MTIQETHKTPKIQAEVKIQFCMSSRSIIKVYCRVLGAHSMPTGILGPSKDSEVQFLSSFCSDYV